MDERATITPDIPVALLASDYFAGKDPALEAALKAVKGDSRRIVRTGTTDR